MRAIVPLLAAAIFSGGCVVVPAPEPPPEPITIELVNATLSDVRPNLYVSSSITDAQTLFTQTSPVRNFTNRPFPELRAGESAVLTFECDELRSLGVTGAVIFDATTLNVVISPDEVFLLSQTDFNCGDLLRFVYYTPDGTLRVALERE